MKLSDETKELILPIVGFILMVSFVCAFFFGFYWMLGSILLKALGIIFNRN